MWRLNLISPQLTSLAVDADAQISALVKLKLKKCEPIPVAPAVGFSLARARFVVPVVPVVCVP
jgi:hypothetical protein